MSQAQMPGGALGVFAAVRFLAELGLLGALGWVGWRLSDTVAVSVVLMVLLPLAAAATWGRWVAPRAKHRLTDPARLAVEFTLFSVAFLGLLLAGPQPQSVLCGSILSVAYLSSSFVGRKGY